MSILGKRTGRPISRIQFNSILKKFIVFLKRELSLTIDIPYILIDDPDFSKKNRAFGMMNSDGIVYISIINRHPLDILRTVAHEYVHYKQSIKRVAMNPNPGSPSENEANAKAGEIMRKYGKLHPELFDLMSIRLYNSFLGDIAQLVERGLCKADVRSSSLLFSTLPKWCNGIHVCLRSIYRKVWRFESSLGH